MLPSSSDASTTTTVSVPPTVAPDSWTVVPAGPLSPRSSAVAVWTGTEVIVVGGEPQAWCPPGGDCAVPDFAPLADGAAFDPADGTWRPIAPAPLTFSGNASAISVHGSVYVLVRGFEVRPGGTGGFLRYDVATDTWHQLPAPGDDWYQITALGSTVVAYSSSDEAGERPDLVLDVTTETWQPLPPDPLSPSFGRAMVEVDGDLYLFAHDLVPNPGSEVPSLLRAARLDVANGVWELRADSEILGGLPVALGEAVVFPNSGSADGGEVNNWGRSYPYGGIYDTANDRWSPLAEPASDDAFSIAGVVGDQTATYVGMRGQVLDLDTGEWNEVRSLQDDSPDVIGRSFVAQARRSSSLAANRGTTAKANSLMRLSSGPRPANQLRVGPEGCSGGPRGSRATRDVTTSWSVGLGCSRRPRRQRVGVDPLGSRRFREHRSTVGRCPTVARCPRCGASC